jgi:hypothetical protein
MGGVPRYYPAPSAIELAAHPTMDPSVPPIAHHTPVSVRA